MASSIYVFIIATFCITGSLQSTPFRNCKIGSPPTDLRISGCNKLPCELKRGTNVTSECDFVASKDINNLEIQVIAHVFGSDTSYPLGDHHPCDSLLNNAHCPLDEGEEVTHLLNMPIKKYPKIKLSLEISLLDENKNVEVCYAIDAIVT